MLVRNEGLYAFLKTVPNDGGGEYRGVAFGASDVTVRIHAELARDGGHVSGAATVARVPLHLVEGRLDDHLLIIDEEVDADLIVGGARREIVQPAGMGIGAHPRSLITGVVLGVRLRRHGETRPVVRVVRRHQLDLDHEVRWHKDLPRQPRDRDGLAFWHGWNRILQWKLIDLLRQNGDVARLVVVIERWCIDVDELLNGGILRIGILAHPRDPGTGRVDVGGELLPFARS